MPVFTQAPHAADRPEGRGAPRAAPSQSALWPVGLCRRELEGLQLMRKTLGRRHSELTTR